MEYISTRGRSAPRNFADVLLSGTAADGGLFVPDHWPLVNLPGSGFARYQDVALDVLSAFAGTSFSRTEVREDIQAAYATFDAPEIAPLVQIGDNLYLLELFHGPSLAFKDVALQLLGRLFNRELKRRNRTATVIVATSGDTGSAAIAALGGLERVTVFVMHPKGRVSDVQRRQMTTVSFKNVHNIALEGSFDDAQAIVKNLFSDRAFSEMQHLAAVNSINFIRIAAQCVYYFTAAARLAVAPAFIVPTGNFGDAFAGEVAMRIGLQAARLVIATNANDILYRALHEGVYAAGPARHTLSPSMDIQAASNFERALFEASGRDAGWITARMNELSEVKQIRLPLDVLAALRQRYEAFRCSDELTLKSIADVYTASGRLIDPHTAVGVSAAYRLNRLSNFPLVVLATAHPAKFPNAVHKATGVTPPLPPRLAHLYEGEERMTVLANDVTSVRQFIERYSGHA